MRDRDLDRVDRDHGHGLDLGARNVLGKLQMDRAGTLFHRGAERVTDHGRNARRADDLPRQLGQRLHRRDDVDNLKSRLPAAHDRLLAGDHDHRHRTQIRVGGSRRQVERAGPQRRNADAGLAGQPPMRGGHEGGGLLVPGQDQLDPRVVQGFDQIEIFFARHTENTVDTFMLERRDEKVRAFCHCQIAPKLLAKLARQYSNHASGQGDVEAMSGPEDHNTRSTERKGARPDSLRLEATCDKRLNSCSHVSERPLEPGGSVPCQRETSTS